MDCAGTLSSDVTCLAFDNKYILYSGSSDKTIKMWKETGKLTKAAR